VLPRARLELGCLLTLKRQGGRYFFDSGAMMRLTPAILVVCALGPMASAQMLDAEWKLAHCGKRCVLLPSYST